MAATGPLERRLVEVVEATDDLAFHQAIPDEIFEAVLEKHGKAKDRSGVKLPHWLVLRLITGLAFLRDLDIPTALERVAAAFGRPKTWWGSVPHSTSIAQARDRLGFGVVRALFRRFAAHLAERNSPRWRGLLVVAIDGTMLDTPDTEANVSAFGRPRGRNGSGGFPKLRMVALVSTVTHFVLGCVLSPCSGAGSGEPSLARSLVTFLRPDWLLLMDKGFCGYPWLSELGDRPFLVRKTQGKTSVKPTRIGPAIKKGVDCWVDYLPKTAERGARPLRLRWIRIKRKKRRGKKEQWLEFLTNLSPESYPYKALVRLYLQRWEVEFAFRELKTGLMRKSMFRSKTPTRVLQEVYGLLTAYNAIRLRMAEAAEMAGVEPRRISFSQSLVILQLASLNGLGRDIVVTLISKKVIPKRKPRSYPRVVKRPASRYAANRRRAGAG